GEVARAFRWPCRVWFLSVSQFLRTAVADAMERTEVDTGIGSERPHRCMPGSAASGHTDVCRGRQRAVTPTYAEESSERSTAVRPEDGRARDTEAVRRAPQRGSGVPAGRWCSPRARPVPRTARARSRRR